MPITWLIHRNTAERMEAYRRDLAVGAARPGARLSAVIGHTDLTDVDTRRFLEMLIRTKKPQIFAENDVRGDGSDWTLRELSLLGDLGVSIDVTIFDDGEHDNPRLHNPPISGTLLFIPGALLDNGSGEDPADWNDVVGENGEIDDTRYAALYERRLLPLLMHAAGRSAPGRSAPGRSTPEQPAFITMPGLGCGQFAGPFHGTLEIKLRRAVEGILEKYAEQLPGIRAVLLDTYRIGEPDRRCIGTIDFIFQPLRKWGHPQLSRPAAFESQGDDFSSCRLFSLVAWDHVSWPGNDFYIGSRATDDGVKAAATDVMYRITGVEGKYDPALHKYQPPEGHRDWLSVVTATGKGLLVDRLEIYGPGGLVNEAKGNKDKK